VKFRARRKAAPPHYPNSQRNFLKSQLNQLAHQDSFCVTFIEGRNHLGGAVQEMTMHARKATFFAAGIAVLLLAMTSLASAAAYSNVFVYGDSLSDVGNIYTVSGHTIPLSPP
jgi:hypothetical protein